VGGQHLGAGGGELAHREGLRRGQAAGQADDVRALGDLQDLADRRGVHLLRAGGEGPGHRHEGLLDVVVSGVCRAVSAAAGWENFLPATTVATTAAAKPSVTTSSGSPSSGIEARIEKKGWRSCVWLT